MTVCIDCGSDRVKVGTPHEGVRLTEVDLDKDVDWRCLECDLRRNKAQGTGVKQETPKFLKWHESREAQETR